MIIFEHEVFYGEDGNRRVRETLKDANGKTLRVEIYTEDMIRNFKKIITAYEQE